MHRLLYVLCEYACLFKTLVDKYVSTLLRASISCVYICTAFTQGVCWGGVRAELKEFASTYRFPGFSSFAGKSYPREVTDVHIFHIVAYHFLSAASHCASGYASADTHECNMLLLMTFWFFSHNSAPWSRITTNIRTIFPTGLEDLFQLSRYGGLI